MNYLAHIQISNICDLFTSLCMDDFYKLIPPVSCYSTTCCSITQYCELLDQMITCTDGFAFVEITGIYSCGISILLPNFLTFCISEMQAYWMLRMFKQIYFKDAIYNRIPAILFNTYSCLAAHLLLWSMF